MSMNLYVCAKLDANTKIGKKTITEGFNLWQTPTNVTRECLAAGNPEGAYRNWINTECRNVVREPVYAEDDIFGDGPAVDYLEYCAADEHLKGLDEWLKDHEGWNFEWYEM